MSDMNDFIQKLRSVEQNVSNQPSAIQRLNIFSPKKTSGSPLQQITDFAKNNAVKAPVPTPTNPVNGKWYKGDDPTRGEVIGKALVLKDTDPTKAGEWMSNYRLLQGTKSSRYYDPHSQATNRAVAELQSRGIDTTGIENPEWFEKNRYLMDYYTPTSGTNEVKTPGKDASVEEQQAFWYRQAYKAMDTTSKAQSELDQVKKDIDWYVNNPGMNLTDQEIKELVMGGLQKNQPTLYAMEQGRASGVPIELNAAVAFNEDLIDGYIWQARNKNKDGSYVTDNPELAMAYAVNGYGNGYQENPELRGKLDPFSAEWKPYSVGSTLEEEGRYFGTYQFSRKWLEDNQDILAGDDEKAKKYYYNVQAAVERSEKIDAETDALDKTIDYYVAKGWSPSKIEQAIQNGSVVPGTGVDGYDDLFDLDKTIEGKDKDKLKGTAWATDYSWDGTKESIAKKVAKKKIADNQDVIDAFGEASEQHANWVLKHENLNQASETVEQFGNNYEKDAFKSIVPGQMGRYALGGFMDSVVAGSHRIGAETIDRIAVQNFEDRRTIQAYDDAQAALEQTNANIENTGVDIKMIASSFYNGEYPNTVEEAQQMLAPIYDKFGYDPSVWEVAGLDISQADDMPAWQILNYMSILENDPDNEDALIGLYQAADNLSYDRGRTYDSRWDQWEGSFIDGHWIGSDEEKAECLASAKDVYKLMQANKYAADIKKEETKKGELEGQISSTQEAYDAALNRRERNAVQLNKAIGYYEADGSKYDSRLMTAMEGMSDIVGKYTPVDYSSTYAYDYMAGMIDPDTGEKAYTPATIYAIATKDMAACAQESANVKAAYALLEKSGYQFSDTERRNMESYVDALDRKGRLASYYVISNDSKYDEYVKAGKALLGAGESGTTAIAPMAILTWLKSEMNPNDPFGNALQMLNSADVLAKVESLTEEDMNRFYAILGRDGEQAAAQYLDDMMNDDYGMITARRSERYSQMTADLVGKDPIIGAIGTAVSVPLKYFGNLEAALYNNFQRGTGQAVGPHSKYSFALDTAYAMREGAKDSLRKLFPFVKEEDFDFVYDALINGAADSLFQAWMTNQAFGSLMQLVPGGDKIANVLSKAADGAYNPIVNTGIKVVSDFSHAAPMGWMAASEAYRQAILNHASPEQAAQVYTITFLAETVSEAITVENIGDMFTAGANATKSGFGTIVKDMVKDAFGEAVGESWGEWYTWEMEKNIDGYKGEWKKNYDIYMEKYHSEEIATELANQDMMRSVMQAGLAAVISSPVSSGVSMYSGARQNRLVGNAVVQMGLGAETSLVELGLSTEEGSNTYQIAKNIDESVSKGQKVKNSAYGELFINLLNSNDENINQKARGILDPEYAAVQTNIQQHKAQIEKVDALKWMTEEVGNHSEEEWKAQSKEDMAFLNGESNATPEAAADNISTVLEGTVVKEQSKPESAAAGTRVVNMAKGDTKAATGAVREILSVDGRSKTDISWAALTNGESHSILQEIINKAAAGTEVTADDVVRLHRAANSEQTGSDSEQMKDSYATNVLNKSAVQPAQAETEAVPSETAQVPAALEGTANPLAGMTDEQIKAGTGLSRQELIQKMNDDQKKRVREWVTKKDKVLSPAEQAERDRQIEELRENFKKTLTPEQQARLEELEAEQRKVGPYKMKAEDSRELRELQDLRDAKITDDELIELLSNKLALNTSEETTQQEETNEQFIDRVTEGVEETEEDVAEREAEEAQEAEMQSQSEQDQAVALQLQNAKDSGMNDVRVAAILKNGTGFGDADAQAIAQKVLGMAGNGDVAGQVIGQMLTEFSGRASEVKQAIAWGAMTDGYANQMLQGIIEDAKAGRNLDHYAALNFLNTARNEQAGLDGEGMKADFARNVLNGRVANEEADIMASENMADATKTEQKEVESAQNEVTRAEEEFDKADKDAAAAAQNLQAAEAEYDPSPDRQETAATLEQATNRVAGAVAQKTDTRTRLDNAKQKLTDAQAALRARQQEIMNETRAAATANTQQNVQQEQIEKENYAKQVAEQKVQQEEQAKEQEAENQEDDIVRNRVDDLIDERYPNATEEEKQRIRDMAKEIASQRRAEMKKSLPKGTQNENATVNDLLKRGQYMKSIAKKFGVNIEVRDTTNGGTAPFKNGYFDPKRNAIVLDGRTTVNDMMNFTIGHELLHMAKNSVTYTELANALLQLRYGEGTTYADIVKKMNAGDLTSRAAQDVLKTKQRYDSQLKGDFDYNYILEEVVADQMGELLRGNQELANRLAAEKPGIVRRIIDNIKSLMKRMTGMQSSWTKDAQNIVDMLERSLNAAKWNNLMGRNISGENDVRNSMPETIVADENGVPLATELPGGTVVLDTGTRYSLSSFNEEEQQKVRNALIASGRFTTEEIDKYMKDALGIANKIAEDRVRLDFEASDNQVFLKPNNDYYFTLDASTLCAKRLLYQGTFDYVQHALPDEVFTPEDLIDLVNIMNDMGYETPCGICYVESRRRWLDTYAQKFLDELPDDAEAFIGKYFKKATDEVKADIRERYAEVKPTIDIDNLTTSDGLEKLRHDIPFMHKAFVDAMNKKGTANPKVVQLRTEYRGDIRNMTAGQIQKVKDIGGLRIQSFSDFETPHLLDMMQAVLDMSAVGLTSQAYTKVPNFAWVFGDTGIKINLSLIGKGTGLDADGNLVFDNREGMNYDEAIKLRERYGKNVGTILVGINDAHIIAAMGDPNIDFIIPFHKSGWSAEELRKMPTLNNYSDYTDTQNERLIIGRNEDGSYVTESFKVHKDRTKESLENFQPVGKNGYWNFDESGQWNAELYLKMCAEAGRVPKFSQFLVDNGDGSFSLPQGTDKRSTAIREGYWKTLIDFKMYENDAYGRTKEDGTRTAVKGARQTEVKPNINMDQAYRVMGDYKLGRQMPDNADGTPGKFIPMENNNSVPVAVPAAEEYIELIKRKREGVKPDNPNPDTLEADLPDDASYNPRAANAFGAYMGDVTLGNTESESTEEFANTASRAIAIDPYTGEEVEIRASLPVTDQETLDFLNRQEENGEVTKTYRTMKLLDGKLVSPKATFINGEVEGDTKLGQWEAAEEHPELIKFDPDNGEPYFELKEKGGRTTKARYNPYMHSSNLMLNDQFKGAYEYSGDNKTFGRFVTVECIVPDSEKNSGYQAQYAKDPVGWTGWKTGPVATALSNMYPNDPNKTRDVFLSRWIKPVRIVPDSEVAQHYKSLLEGTGIKVPANVITNSLREELEKAGVEIGPPEEKQRAKFERTTGRRYSLPQDAPYMAAVERGEMDEAQRMVDEKAKENGYDVEYLVWRGDSQPYNELEPGENGGNLGTGLYFTPDRSYAERFATKNSPVRKFYLKKGNTFDYNAFAQEFNDYAMNWLEENDMEPRMGNIDEYTWSMIWDDFISENGYDSVMAADVGGLSYGAREIAVQNSWQAKLADPVTYDDQGNVIPLSERFNDQSNDIRYSLPSDDVLRNEIAAWLEDYEQNPENRAEPEGPQRQFGYQTAQTSDELSEATKRYLYEHSNYTPDTNQAQVERAVDWLRETGYTNAVQDVTDKKFNSQSPDGQAQLLATLAMAIAKGDETAEIMIADAYNREGTIAGQTLQARKIFRMMTPFGRKTILRKMLTDEQSRLNAKSVNVNLKFSDWIYRAAEQAENEEDFNAIRKAAAKELGEQIPPNWKDQLRSIRMLSMLLNPRTHVRNFIGNALFIPAVSIKNKLGAVGEMVTRQDERTKTLALAVSPEIRAFAREVAKQQQDNLTGEAKYNERQLIQQNVKQFTGAFSWLQKLSDFNSNALEAEDWFFLKGHFRRAFGGWMQANGYSVDEVRNNASLMEQGVEYAKNEAQKATYRDFNQLAATLNKVSRQGGAAGFFVDAVLPFKKTPANILKRGIEYSPIGLARGLYELTRPYHAYQKAVKNNTEIPSYAKSPNQVIDQICSGLSGSMVFAIGAILANMGAVSIGLGDDDDEFDKLKGAQKYAINPGRIVNNLFGVHLLGEDVTYTMDWAAPMSMPFFVGAAFQNIVSGGSAIDSNKLVNAFMNITEPVFNLSMLDGVNSLLKTNSYTDENSITQIGTKILMNYATSYIPSALGAIARIHDPYRRMSYVETKNKQGSVGTFYYSVEQAQNKIPFLSESNIPYRDVWGNPQGDASWERHIENLLSPGYIGRMQSDPVMDELERLYNAEETPEKERSKMVPKQPGQTINITKSQSDNPRKIELTAEEWDTYRVARGQTAYQTLSDLMQNPYYLNASEEQQCYMIDLAWDYADQEGKKAVAPDYVPDTYFGPDPVETIISNAKSKEFDKKYSTGNTGDTPNVKKNKDGMFYSLDAGDPEAYDAMVQALRDDGVTDKQIKTAISNRYRKQYQTAYLEDDIDTMLAIQEKLGMTGYSFDYNSWRKSADKNKLKEELEEEDF